MRLNLKIGRIAGATAVAAMVAMFAAGPARADVIGELTCNIAGGPGQIIVSSRSVSCVFHSNAGPAELYNGSLNRLGVDIGELAGGRLVYQVVAIGAPAPGALAGDYVGGGFDLSLGAGGGINALVGGGGGSFALQPLSATTSTGTNINAGATALRLAFAGPEAGPPVGRLRRVKHRRVYRVAHPHHAAHHHAAHHHRRHR